MTVSSIDQLTDTFGGLAFWHPLSDVPLPDGWLDWGSVAAGSSADLTCRVRNLSDDYTATGILVEVDGPLVASVTDVSGAHYLSADGQTFTATCAVADLAPGQTSDPFTIRRVTAPDAAGAGGFSLTATAAAWYPAAAGGTDDSTSSTTGDDGGFDPNPGTLLENPEDQM